MCVCVCVHLCVRVFEMEVWEHDSVDKLTAHIFLRVAPSDKRLYPGRGLKTFEKSNSLGI